MKKTALIFGWIFLVIGVLGLFSNPVISMTGFFHADLAHNIVHILTGVILLWVGYKSAAKLGLTLKVFGFIYLIVALIGFFSSGTVLGILAVNGAANVLHLVIALIFLWVGFKGSSKPAPVMSQPQA